MTHHVPALAAAVLAASVALSVNTATAAPLAGALQPKNAAPSHIQTVGWGGRGGAWGGGGGWRGGGWRGGGYGWRGGGCCWGGPGWGAVGAGIVAGAIVGAAVAGPPVV